MADRHSTANDQGSALWGDTPTLYGPDGRPYRKAVIESPTGDDPAVVNEDYDRPLERNEERTPDFAGHPCPPAAQMLWLCARRSGVAPPWRLRCSAWMQARYGRQLITAALGEYAEVLWDLAPDPRLPEGFQLVMADQLDVVRDSRSTS